MARRKSAGDTGPRKATRAELAAENARLRRALARQGRRGDKQAVSAPDRDGPRAELATAREQQAATAEILRLIASSPDDTRPVFDAIARHTVRLSDGQTALVVRYDGALLHLVAHENVAPERLDRVAASFPRPPERTFPMGVAVLDGTVVHVPDFPADTRVSGVVATRAGLGTSSRYRASDVAGPSAPSPSRAGQPAASPTRRSRCFKPSPIRP